MNTDTKFIDPIPKEFLRLGVKHTYVSENDGGFLYELNDNGYIYYEVFKKRLCNKMTRVGNKIEILEDQYIYMYPKDKSFGLWAWTTPILSRAYQILDRLNIA